MSPVLSLSRALLPTPPSPPPLLSIPTVITCFGQQSLPPLLPTPSFFLLWHILCTKLKFSTDLISIANKYHVIESASSFVSHVHEQPTKISDKIIQNNGNYGIRVDDRNKLDTFNVGVVQKLHACISDPFLNLMKLSNDIYVIDLLIYFGISSTFNIDCLVNYKCLITVSYTHLTLPTIYSV